MARSNGRSSRTVGEIDAAAQSIYFRVERLGMTEATIQTRIASFDVIRGVAVMGIFSVNVMSFGMIASAYLNPTAFGGQTGANFLVWAANLLLIDGKMRSLFSILFGASMMLVIERAEAQGRSALRTHMSRMAVLFGFGVVH